MTVAVQKIISGGQTGVDRAALDFAIENKIPHGGYCPQGRLAEDGRIDDRYQLTETESPDYTERTEKNVLASDGTLILDYGTLSGGTLLTVELCHRHQKPVLIIDMTEWSAKSRERFRKWIESHPIAVLNVAGSRESKYPIYEQAKEYLSILLT